MPEPTIGRFVHYHPKTSTGDLPGPYSAQIVYVDEQGNVDLKVSNPAEQRDQWFRRVPCNHANPRPVPGTWDWPVFVK